MNRTSIQRKKSCARTAKTIGAALLLAVYLLPLYILFSIALKSKEEFARNHFGLTANIRWSNLIDAMKAMNFTSALMNSTIISVVSIALVLILAALASYALARRRAKLYGRLYIFFLAGMMIPFQLTMLPLYKLITDLGLMRTRLGVIFIYIALFIPIAIVILTGFIKTVPRELDEAALLDGATPFRTFISVILPLIKAPLVTVMIFCFTGIWNDLLTPLLFLGGGKQTLIIALYSFVGAFSVTDWTMIFAGSIVTMLPLLAVFLVCQKSFINGMVAGAVKG
jgi:raffinose/stachyose/melibiose transport system permease protein